LTKDNSVDTQTRHALKKDKFAQAAASSASWVGEHRSSVVRWTIIGVVTLAVVVGGLITWNLRTSAADDTLGAAMDIYTSPLQLPGEPAQTGTYATAAERAKAANAKFMAVAEKYGWMKQGRMARYFAGITDQELGQNAQAETELKSVTGSWDRNLANLAKVALAGIYHQTGRDNQAIDLYNQIIAKPSTTVPAAAAQLDLADLYAAQGKQDQARALWAKVQDSDKQGAAGEIAQEKLHGNQ
jgi:predicted negative regulator of RcsB-dependent stress response